jgi:hypothetical protein
MNFAELMHLSFEQAVEKIGDPAPRVFSLMYQRFPDLLRYRDENPEWENYMMQEIMTNLMQYAEDPETARVTLRDMSAHHELIGVPNSIFRGMYNALFDVFSTAFYGPHRDAMVTAWKDSIQGINTCIVGVNG